MEKDIGDFLENEFLSAEKASWVCNKVVELLDMIHQNAVALIVAFDFTDYYLKSALEHFDGKVYHHIFEATKKDVLNQTKPGPKYDPYLCRLIYNRVGVYTGTFSCL